MSAHGRVRVGTSGYNCVRVGAGAQDCKWVRVGHANLPISNTQSPEAYLVSFRRLHQLRPSSYWEPDSLLKLTWCSSASAWNCTRGYSGLHSLLHLIAPAPHNIRVRLHTPGTQQIGTDQRGTQCQRKQQRPEQALLTPICSRWRSTSPRPSSAYPGIDKTADEHSTIEQTRDLVTSYSFTHLPGTSGCQRPGPQRATTGFLSTTACLRYRSIWPRRPPSVMRHSTRMALARYRSVLLFMSFISELVTMITCPGAQELDPCHQVTARHEAACRHQLSFEGRLESTLKLNQQAGS